mmetsp:Transcript_42449/g.96065  ORF Transcript_42449/g.96065 Transcript_42449/m.96065 type:complete len:223 (+) Transcript_42449:153-821(+)|eukprot:CAMPEP_0172625506 /NCGR_PEP_ID=MMETSP1068-20121228/144178_1 /TAXON_ID=35684 /ORGANISM="Pseudopedinella elastica, Strain CCMP716" /LENGTH=222 /DNA_ID=CAMNT_0013434819 /DNA_START=88 /DNA_END=756 /DNA_ORIENTATION=+
MSKSEATQRQMSTMRESCKPVTKIGLPEWMSDQTAPRVAMPPSQRISAPGYCGHSPLVQTEIQDEKTSQAAQPQILLHSHRMQVPPQVGKAELRLDRTFQPGESRQMVPRVKHVAGYRGFQRGNKCKEDLGDLERTAELEMLLRQLGKGVNGVTFSGYNILHQTPTKSVQQELHPMQMGSPVLTAGTKMHKRLQSAETAYADAYAKMNQGTGPFAAKRAADA